MQISSSPVHPAKSGSFLCGGSGGSGIGNGVMVLLFFLLLLVVVVVVEVEMVVVVVVGGCRCGCGGDDDLVVDAGVQSWTELASLSILYIGTVAEV